MLSLFDVLSNRRFNSNRDELKLLLAQEIDVFSFGIILLKYANKIKSLVNSHTISSKYNLIHETIYEFLKESLILNPFPIRIVKKKIFFFFTRKRLHINNITIDDLKNQFDQLILKINEIDLD